MKIKRQRDKMGGLGAAPPSRHAVFFIELFAFVNCVLGFFGVYIVAGNHYVVCAEARFDAVHISIDGSQCILHADLSHLIRKLGNHHVYNFVA